MEKRIGRNWLRWLCVGLLCLASVGNRSLRAEGVPPVIKYQAVLRNVEGEPMVERTGLSLRITLRQGTPDGKILYQETHTDKATDAFGLLLLEIGRGDVSDAGPRSLSDVTWENSPIYAQVEIQADDNGYTMMGASELLSVPYALYAGNASVGYGLTDGFLPKYDVGYLNLVDSKISETYDGQLQFYTGDEAYKFPTVRGNKNQTLVLIDDEGTLGWRAGGGGGGGAGCEDCHDGFLTYWDEMNGQLHTTDMRYDEPTGAVYAGSQFISPELMIVENELEINGTVSGNHNLQYKDLPHNHVWVGNKQNQSEAYRLGGDGVTIDSLNKVLRFGGGASVWGFQPEGATDYVYTKLNDGQYVRVGIGLERPKTRLHVQDGALLLSGTPGDDQDAPGDWEAGNHLYWHAGTGALRIGKLEDGKLSLWNTANLGENSIALGTEAQANKADNVAIGKKTEAQGDNAMVFGQNSVANDAQGLALGHNLFVSGANAVGIGHGSAHNLATPTFKAAGAQSVSMGYDVVNEGDDAVAIGTNLELSKAAAGSVVLGTGHEIEGEQSVAIGSDIKGKRPSVVSTSDRNFQIGMDLKVVNGSSDAISIGQINEVDKCEAGTVNIGMDLTTRNSNETVNIGFGNVVGPDYNAGYINYGPIVIGHKLEYEDESGVILGTYNNKELDFWDLPALVVGAGKGRSQRRNVLELSEKGELSILGDKSEIHVKTVDEWSDIRLKTDIQPLDADDEVLQALQPVRYRFKEDEEQILRFGFIAQDVERYFPHLVSTSKKGIKSLNYTGLLPVLWQYTQRLERTVETQAAEIDRLKTELESLKADVQAIKAAMGIGE